MRVCVLSTGCTSNTYSWEYKGKCYDILLLQRGGSQKMVDLWCTDKYWRLVNSPMHEGMGPVSWLFSKDLLMWNVKMSVMLFLILANGRIAEEHISVDLWVLTSVGDWSIHQWKTEWAPSTGCCPSACSCGIWRWVSCFCCSCKEKDRRRWFTSSWTASLLIFDLLTSIQDWSNHQRTKVWALSAGCFPRTCSRGIWRWVSLLFLVLSKRRIEDDGDWQYTKIGQVTNATGYGPRQLVVVQKAIHGRWGWVSQFFLVPPNRRFAEHGSPVHEPLIAGVLTSTGDWSIRQWMRVSAPSTGCGARTCGWEMWRLVPYFFLFFREDVGCRWWFTSSWNTSHPNHGVPTRIEDWSVHQWTKVPAPSTGCCTSTYSQ